MLVELPMVTMEPPDSTNFCNCGTVFSSVMRPTQARYSAGTLAGSVTRAAAPGAAARCRTAADRAVGEHEDVEFGAEIAGVEGRRPDALEREIVLLEKPASPAGRHAAAVGIVESDADRLELQRVAGGRLRDGVRRDAELFRGAVDSGLDVADDGHPDSAGAEIRHLLLHPIHIAVCLRAAN